MISLTAKLKTTKSRAQKTAAQKQSKATKSKSKQSGQREAAKSGVIATIVELLSAASSKKPLSKSVLADKLKERLPERDRDAMMRTIQCQVPVRLVREKKLKVRSSEAGYWIQ